MSDAARVQMPWYRDPELKLTENLYLQGPQDDYAAPGTHFRHMGVANVGYLDGHVTGVKQVDPPYPKSWSIEAGALARKNKLGYITPSSFEGYRSN